MSNTATIEIARATPIDAPALGAMLARAFHDDPVFGWVVRDSDARRERLPLLFAAFAEAYLSHHETYVAGDDVGAALWAPPGSEPIPADRAGEFKKGLADALNNEDLDRGLRIQELLEAHHPEQPCFYLQFMGVVPEHQGRGLGSQLLTTVLKRCDAATTPAYLEATSPDNRRLYERHGFETLDEIAVPGGPPMWREPVATS